MPDYSLRLAEITDAEDILAIYRPYILETAVSFEYEPPTIEQFVDRMRSVMPHYPYLVCVNDKEIVGYAYARRHQERQAYQWNCELSIYLRKDIAGKGIGKLLYHCLIEILRLQNICNVYGCLTVPNRPSEKLHQAMGFSLIGVFEKTGYKFGRWRDTAWYGKHIGDMTGEPKPFVSLTRIDPAVLAAILKSR